MKLGSSVFGISICLVCIASGCAEIAVDGFPIRSGVPCTNDAVEIIDTESIRFCGITDANSIDLVIEALEETGAKKMVITSTGGHTESAMRLGRYIRENDIAIYIDALCLSSCSQIIALSATTLFIRFDSVFGMHDSQAATNIVAGYVNTSTEMAEEAVMEAEFYAEMNIPLSLLYQPLMQLGIGCIANLNQYADTGGLIVKSKYNYYMPTSAEFLDVFPGVLHSPWPTEQSTRERFERFREKFSLSFIYGMYTDEPLRMSSECVNE